LTQAWPKKLDKFLHTSSLQVMGYWNGGPQKT